MNINNINIGCEKSQINKIFGETKIVKDKIIRDNNEKNDDILDVSLEGIRRQEMLSKEEYKYSGVTSTREVWEDKIFTEKYRHSLYKPSGSTDISEMFRLDRPDEYALYDNYMTRFMQVTVSEGLDAAIEQVYNYDLANLEKKWMDEKLFQNPNYFINPSSSRGAVLDTLDLAFSDKDHNVSFDIFSELSENIEDIWKYSSKFSIQLTERMFENLVSPDKDTQRSMIDLLMNKVNELKEAEVNYHGSKAGVRFGIRIIDMDNIEYYARYGYGKQRVYDIKGNSVKELLDFLND